MKNGEARIIVAPTQGLLKKIQAIREKFGDFNWYGELDSNGNIDTSGFPRMDIADVDAGGEVLMEQYTTPFMSPDNQPCYYSDTTPVLVQHERKKVAATDKRITPYYKAFRGFNKLSQAKKDQIIAIIETGIWVGLLTDPDNHRRVVKVKQLIQKEV